jgi:ABC-2 type transport system permease protein
MLPVTWQLSAVPGVLLVVVLGSLTGATLGMVLGTSITPRHITVMFAVILTPLMFTGSVQFPLLSLNSSLWWYRVLCSINPLSYVSEALRAFVAPDVPHVALWISLLVLAVSLALFGSIGIRGFLRRAIN